MEVRSVFLNILNYGTSVSLLDVLGNFLNEGKERVVLDGQVSSCVWVNGKILKILIYKKKFIDNKLI